MFNNKIYLVLQSAVVCVILFIVISYPSKMSGKKLLSVEFEVFGRVQGVFFRKYTQEESNKLGLKGWCMNTDRGTVQGIMEGEEPKINDMKNWLKNIGSPSSKIDKAEFKNQKEILKHNFSGFTIKR